MASFFTVYNTALDTCRPSRRTVSRYGMSGVAHSAPSIGMALCAGILSANNNLARNSWQVEMLRRYVARHGELPTQPYQVEHVLYGSATATRKQCDALAYVGKLERKGELEVLRRKPDTLRQWLAWRHVACLLPCVGYKTASMAAMLLWPTDSPLVPIDRHVVAWMSHAGALPETFTPHGIVHCDRYCDYRRYAGIEARMRRIQRADGLQCSVALYHWYRWANWRIERGIAKDIEPHVHLSPYVY